MSFLRFGANSELVVVLNLTPVPRIGYRLGVPRGGSYREVFNSDSRFYGGSDLGNPIPIPAEATPWMEQAYSIPVTLPPLAGIVLEWG
jgi:1,4-alpha-glucan branching enzyme